MIKLITKLTLLTLSIIISMGANAAENQGTKRVRMIFGFENIGVWEQSFIATINQILLSDPRGIELSTEFLQLTDSNSAELFNEYQQLRPNSADLIIAVQPEAASFVNRWQNTFFRDVQKLYVSPYNETIAQVEINQSANVIPSAVEDAAKETLTLMPRLLPDLNHVYVVAGSSNSDSSYLRRIQSAAATVNPQQEIHYLAGLTPEDLITQLNSSPQRSATLFASFNEDNTGQLYDTAALMTLVREQISMPIFGLYDSALSAGIVGGSVTSSILYGEKAAATVLSMLFDEPLPESASTTTGYMFNAPELQRWGIDTSLLPEGSQLLNYNPSLLERYFWQFIAGLIIFLLQLITILALGSSLRRRNTAEKERDQKIVENIDQENLFESVINSIPDAIFITNTKSNLVATNIGAQTLFGFNQKELTNRPIKELIDFSLGEKKPPNAGETAQEKNIDPAVITYKNRNGGSFSGETISTSIKNIHGEILGYFALIRDVSKRLSQEEERRQGQKMEALGNLVGGISHDFNNILGVISGYTELLLMDEDQESLESHQHQILQATGRAKMLVTQIMTFSRDDNTQQVATDLGNVLEDTMKLISVSIPRRIKINFHKAADITPVMGSSIQLQQIILNLTTNAYQAMKSSKGTIEIGVENVCIKEDRNLSHGVLEPGNYSCLFICDDGPGMSSEVAARIFEPYFTTKAEGEGSGMGMAIVYNLIKLHGAMLDLKTAPDEGACFKLYFKELPDDNAPSFSDKDKSVVRGNGQRILLVDDEAGLLETTKRLLTNIGYQVSAFQDPTVALEAFKKSPDEFDLLITDQNMPELTGLQLLELLYKIKPNLLTIICTGYTNVIDSENVDHLNVHCILIKPVTLSEISHAISSSGIRQDIGDSNPDCP